MVSEAAMCVWGIFILYKRSAPDNASVCTGATAVLWGAGCVVAGTCVCMLATLYAFFRLTRLVFDMLTGMFNIS